MKMKCKPLHIWSMQMSYMCKLVSPQCYNRNGTRPAHVLTGRAK